MRKLLCLALLLVVHLASGCGDKKPAPKVDTRPDPEVARAELAKREAEPSVSLPAGLKGRLAFVAKVVDEGRLVVLVPRDWTATSLPDHLRPPEGADLGFMSELSVTSNCDGSCTAKDWPAIAEKVDLAQLRGADFTVVKDETLPDGKLLVAKTVDRTYVVRVLWQTGASRYAVCRATLDQELGEATDAFESACRSMRVVSWQ